MFRLIGKVFAVILVVFIVWFAVSNTEPVAFKMDLLFPALALPGYIWGFILLGIGFLLGEIAMIAAGADRRKKSRNTKKELKQAKKAVVAKDKKIAEMVETSGGSDVNPVAVLTQVKTSQ